MRTTTQTGAPYTHLRRRLVLAVLTVSLFLTRQGCKTKEVVQAASPVGNPLEVVATPAIAENLQIGGAEMRDVQGTLQVAARIQTDAGRIARVGSSVEGRILRLMVLEGQTVHAGQVLAALHSTDLSDARLSLVKGHSEQALADAGAKRAEQLVAADVIGRAELERRRAEALQANAEVEGHRTQLRGLGMGETQISRLEKTHQLSADYPIVAPRSGSVLEREITVGQVVEPADQAFTIADLSTIWVIATVPEEDVGRLAKGMKVVVCVPALPEAEVHGELSYVAPTVDSATRTVEVRMNLGNPQGLYKPDQLASMTLTEQTERRLTVPSADVVREDNQDYVFVPMSQVHFVLRPVVLDGERDDRRIDVRGLTARDRIVIDGAFHLNNQRKQNAVRGGQ